MLDMTSSEEPLLAVDWNDRTQSALQIIKALAAKHGVGASVSELDKYAGDMARLAGDDVQLDEVEQMLANVGKLGLYDGKDLTRLHARYLTELASN